MTDRYAHLSPEVWRKAVETLDWTGRPLWWRSTAGHTGPSTGARTGARTGVDSAGDTKGPSEQLTVVPSPAPLETGEIAEVGSHK